MISRTSEYASYFSPILAGFEHRNRKNCLKNHGLPDRAKTSIFVTSAPRASFWPSLTKFHFWLFPSLVDSKVKLVLIINSRCCAIQICYDQFEEEAIRNISVFSMDCQNACVRRRIKEGIILKEIDKNIKISINQSIDRSINQSIKNSFSLFVFFTNYYNIHHGNYNHPVVLYLQMHESRDPAAS